LKIARQAREDEEDAFAIHGSGYLMWDLRRTTASTGQRHFVTVCATRFARLRTNRANPLRGTGLPVKPMLDGRLRRAKKN